MMEEEKKEQEKNTAPCSICYKKIEDTENAPILAMGHYGTPRYICPECEELIETAQKSREIEKIESAMSRLGQTVGNVSAGDEIVLETVEEIFRTATERAEKIKLGTYDFSLDEAEGEEFELEEIPEELLETEEDKKKTEREAEINKKFNKVMDIITAAVFIAAVAALICFFILK